MTHVSYARLSKRPALFERLTGLTLAEFTVLLDTFTSQYGDLVVKPRLLAESRQRALGGGQKGSLPMIEDKLLFILMYTRVYPLLVVQGMFFGLAESKACKWVGVLLPVLDAALGSARVRPKRAKGRSLEEVIEEFPELGELGVLTDGVERPIQRSKDKDIQKEHYSGKKKRHTKKHVTFTHPKHQFILAASEEHPGTHHDKRILDEEQLSCNTPIPLGADTGFIGTELGRAKLILPIKKKRKKKGEPKDTLTDEQKAYNKTLASSRVAIEHSNAGFKRNRSVKDILRNTRDGMSDQLAIVAMSLHNLRVTMRMSYRGT